MSFIKQHKKELIIAITSVVAIVGTYYVLRHYVFNHRAKLRHTAKKDLKFWDGKKETDPAVSKALVEYWKLVGKDFTEKQMQSASTHSSYPWSSAYIGHLVNKAGYKNFSSKSTHSAYVVDAKRNRAENLKRAYWAYKPSELKRVEVGDILVKGRSGSKPNLDTINSGVISHGDIVIEIKKIDGQKYAITQGGNVSDTVKQTKVALTNNERLLNPVQFAQLKYTE